MPMNPRLMRPLARLQSPPPPPPCEHEASLLLHFDGNLTDSSANGLTVTAVGGAATSTTQSKFGGASAAFNGSGQRLDIPTGGNLAFVTDDFTVELWAYFGAGSNNGEHVLFSQASPADTVGVSLAIYQNDLMWLIGDGGGSWLFQRYPGGGHFSAGSVVAGQWNHLAITRSGSTFRLFANGVIVDTYTSTASLPDTNSLANVGGRSNYGQYFNGYIDDVRITKGLAVYKGPFTPPTAPLTAIATPQPANASLCLNFDGSFADEGVNAVTVTAVGGAAISTTTKKFGSGAAYFDGSGDYLQVSNEGEFDFGTGDFTIEAWVYPTDVSYPNTIVGKRGSGESDLAFVLYVYQGSTYLVVSSDGTSWALNGGGTATVNNNAWGHIALVRKGSTFSVYWNGVLSQSFSSSSSIFNSSVPLRIGGGGAANQDLVGYIDGLRITKAALYCDEFMPPTAPPTPTAVPPCCQSAPPPSCDPYGTYIRSECQGFDYGDVYADGDCGEYFEVTSYEGCL